MFCHISSWLRKSGFRSFSVSTLEIIVCRDRGNIAVHCLAVHCRFNNSLPRFLFWWGFFSSFVLWSRVFSARVKTATQFQSCSLGPLTLFTQTVITCGCLVFVFLQSPPASHPLDHGSRCHTHRLADPQVSSVYTERERGGERQMEIQYRETDGETTYDFCLMWTFDGY